MTQNEDGFASLVSFAEKFCWPIEYIEDGLLKRNEKITSREKKKTIEATEKRNDPVRGSMNGDDGPGCDWEWDN